MSIAKPININSKGEQLDLTPGKYQIHILGGWGIRLGDFSVSFKHNETQQIIRCVRSLLPVQSFILNTRARRVFVFKVEESGRYTIEFANAETLKVRPSNLFFRSLFEEPIPNDKIQIYIHEDGL
ncbi:hypothetical protein [Ohtaekwangia koreensis]|uniref:Uncharacterized protein n=1 Tax=Ohtaekwangia koreensis TaxID=688867 RepID=A0A1T5MKY8_9BACT|nr:hypothetical protein [Ohtaekwangia koreensis]SKC88885.1 hypothetical protein SAMN05660236_5719 [Ohtaekwangia koreensis]